MIKSFNKEEKMALIAILKFIANSDGRLTESELSTFNKVAEEKGFEDFSEIFNEVDRDVQSIDDIKGLIKKVAGESHKKDIVKYAVDIALADANINRDEAKIMKIIKDEWDIDMRELIKKG